MLELFTAKATGSPMKLQLERDLILGYQINGYDQNAMELLWQYRGILQKALYNVVRAVSRMTEEQKEDLSQELLATAIQTINEFDLDQYERLSQVLPSRLRQTASEVATALEVPRGTLALWFKIWRAGNKDFSLATELAPTMGMSQDTFRSITAALEYSEAEWVTAPYSEYTPTPDLVTYQLARKALDVLTPAELVVIEHAYGFRGDPKSDGDIANVLEMPRPSVSTTRTRGLVRMRKTLIPEAV